MSEHDDSYEPHHESSTTDHVLHELQIYGYRPFADEPDGRPLPEGNHVAGAIAGWLSPKKIKTARASRGRRRGTHLKAFLDFDGVERPLGVALALAHDDAAAAHGAVTQPRRAPRRQARDDGAHANRARGAGVGALGRARDGANRGGGEADHSGTDHGDSLASRGGPDGASRIDRGRRRQRNLPAPSVASVIDALEERLRAT